MKRQSKYLAQLARARSGCSCVVLNAVLMKNASQYCTPQIAPQCHQRALAEHGELQDSLRGTMKHPLQIAAHKALLPPMPRQMRFISKQLDVGRAEQSRIRLRIQAPT